VNESDMEAILTIVEHNKAANQKSDTAIAAIPVADTEDSDSASDGDDGEME